MDSCFAVLCCLCESGEACRERDEAWNCRVGVLEESVFRVEILWEDRIWVIRFHCVTPYDSCIKYDLSIAHEGVPVTDLSESLVRIWLEFGLLMQDI